MSQKSYKYVKLADGKTAKGVYQVSALSISDSRFYAFKDLNDGKTAKMLAFVDTDGNIINF